MEKPAEIIASDWIAYARLGPDQATEELFADGWELVDLAFDQPELAWLVILNVISRYDMSDLQADADTEAKTVLGLTAAGPLEDLLSYHGPIFIDRIENETRRDPRFLWTLRGVWKCGMSDEFWARVQQMTGGIVH